MKFNKEIRVDIAEMKKDIQMNTNCILTHEKQVDEKMDTMHKENKEDHKLINDSLKILTEHLINKSA